MTRLRVMATSGGEVRDAWYRLAPLVGGLLPLLNLSARCAEKRYLDIRMILSQTASDADGPTRLLGQYSSCRAARLKGYQDHVIRHQTSVKARRSVQIRGRADPLHESESGETRVAIQIRGRIRATGRRRLSVSGGSSGERRSGDELGNGGWSDLETLGSTADQLSFDPPQARSANHVGRGSRRVVEKQFDGQHEAGRSDGVADRGLGKSAQQGRAEGRADD